MSFCFSLNTFLVNFLDFSMHLICITGSSQGFGLALAIEIIKSTVTKGHTTLLLINRTKTDQEILLHEYTNTEDNHNVKVVSINCDIAIEKKFKFFDDYSFARKAWLFNNAGTLGKLDYVQNLEFNDINNAIRTNLIGTMSLTSSFLRAFKNPTIINVSSLAALQPFETWSIYSSCKSALDMFHKTIALENSDCRVVNYAPGPLDTRMQQQIRDSMPDCKIRQLFQDMHEKKQLIQPSLSARKLLSLLESYDFESGAHIDFYDV